MPIKIGSVIDERYRVVARIGHGGMAEVYEASDIITKKRMAIKLIREDVMKNPINLRRFQNEATIAASLDHPNIVKVYNHGTFEGIPYIANEYVAGQNLKDVLDFRSCLPIQEAVSIMIQLTAALSYAHQHNIVHRDVKPQNIFYLPDGTVKLGDFGIAETLNITMNKGKPKEIIGSVHYLAPEISRGYPASPQSDIYAAGVTFFELITGRVPFNDVDPVAVVVAHIREKVPSPRKYLPNCSKEVEKIIARATNRSLKERYQNAQDMHDDLVELNQNSKLLKEKKNFFARFFGFK
ncbi:MAG: serine/threonine protein kinase [Erysipelotrichaceae bacterium]|nr:serine/threonine protein kinase [Erysipelotrichaceae bacterium]